MHFWNTSVDFERFSLSLNMKKMQNKTKFSRFLWNLIVGVHQKRLNLVLFRIFFMVRDIKNLSKYHRCVPKIHVYNIY